jgi:hypothetical protein
MLRIAGHYLRAGSSSSEERQMERDKSIEQRKEQKISCTGNRVGDLSCRPGTRCDEGLGEETITFSATKRCNLEPISFR